MQRELFNSKFDEFMKCFRPFKRAAMMIMWPTVNMSLTPLISVIKKTKITPRGIFLQCRCYETLNNNQQLSKRTSIASKMIKHSNSTRLF